MFYRRKILLSLIEAVGSPALSKTDLQKHLFLFTRRQEEPSFDFVPHKFGCFSFSAEADFEPMVKKGFLSGGETWQKALTGTQRYANTLLPHDLSALKSHQRQYRGLRGCDLVKTVHENYPYYTIRSEIAEATLGSRRAAEIRAEYAAETRPALFTIGYEGRSVEDYLNQLIQNGVNVLVDVRRNPISRKYGFSKTRLAALTAACGIDYKHVPELGIESSKRKSLSSSMSYEALFEEYRRDALPKQQPALQTIEDLISRDGRRVALTCFEREHISCHRDSVAIAISNLKSCEVQPRHL